jgi:hypothetical protein
MSWIVSAGVGTSGGCVMFRALIMHRMFGRSLAWHWHLGVCTFEKPKWGCLFRRFVVKVSCIG